MITLFQESGKGVRQTDEVKACGRCHREKPREAFSRSAGSSDGLQGWCKSCRREHDRAHSDVRYHFRAANRTRGAGGKVVEFVDRSVVFERDNWACWICCESVDPKREWPDPLSASVDHIEPISQGGEHSYANTRLAHLGCNSARRDAGEEASA
jgi:hypothetical protein